MSKKVLSLLLMGALACSLLVGCGNNAAEESAPETEAEESVAEEETVEDEIVIGFCNASETMDFFVTVKESMQNACDAAGIKMLYATDDMNAEVMRSNWDSFVNQGADIIVDASILVEAGSSLATQYAKSGNVPVLSMDCVYENAYFFGVNNEQAGVVAGEYVAEKVNEKWNGQVDAMLQFYLEQSGDEVKKRNEGIYTGMIDSGIELAEENVTWINAQGTTTSGYDASVMKSLVVDYLTANQDAKHIVIGCWNDDGAAAALAAAKASGREDDVMIISHNADPAALENLAQEGENSWIGTVCYSPDTYGDQMVALCQKILSGEEVGTNNYAHIFVIGEENIDEYYTK